MSRPNILFILTDQQRWDSLGCYNTPGVHTPNLDRLAEEGVRYNQCYVNSTICTPSRASLWTGKHVTGHGVHTLHDVLPQDEVLFPEHLRKVGYDTALFGKLHVAGHIFEADNRHRYDGFNHYDWCPDPRSYRGADNAYWRWLAIHHPDILDQISNSKGGIGHIPKEGHMTTWAANMTIDYLQSMQGTHRPFFCCMGVFDPHSPYDNYPLEYRDLIDGDALPPVFNPDEPFENRPIAHFEEHDKKGDFPSLEELKEIRIGYHAAVALIDEQVGRVLHTLEATGFADNTVVLFTSDHGDMLGDHGLSMKGAFMYDACTRVPMLVRWPNNPAGSTINASCQLHDIAGTALTLAGYTADEIAAWMPDARNLLDENALVERGYAALMHRNPSTCRDRAANYSGYHDPPLHITMWREGRYKFSIYHSPEPTNCPGELFDMDTDPQEMNNLWNDPSHQETRDRLWVKLTNWLVQQESQGRARGTHARPPGFLEKRA